MLAGAGASLLTNPLDLIKLRLQVGRGSKAAGISQEFAYKHMVDGLFQVIKTEGPLALWNGSFARMCTHFPTVAISMGIIEATKPYMHKILE
mmetsp:Transcript_9141/g.10341  ORF Transcript_9141/g.10341 Transcript_9141/m.10341 type:complete len:92 (+) Transcript_9141:44-319(+)